MRFPFDLVAAILCVGEITRYLTLEHGGQLAGPSALTATLQWGGFLLVTWLLNELVTRGTEWRTRFGVYPAGLPGRRHPLIFHTWAVRAVQFLTVILYALVLINLQWPLFVSNWPAWMGLAHEATLGRLKLADSGVAALVLNLAPFLAAMVLSWVPRRRLASGLRRRKLPLLPFLGVEAKLTWLPLVLALVLSVIQDAAQALPPAYTAWAEPPLNQILLLLGVALFAGALALPWLIIWMWSCQPLPEGELKTRLQALLLRSGVKARAILVWGSRKSGLINACVLGPWARMRYVLISPALTDELSMDETEAVLAHELGHARYGHLSFYFVLILWMAVMLDPLAQMLSDTWQGRPLLQAGAVMAFVIFYIFCFFGSISRQCEREADLASAELMGSPVPLILALEKLAVLMGNIRGVGCWHHGSIAQRVAAVQRLCLDPKAGARLHTRLKVLRVLLVILTVVVLGLELYARLES